MCMMPRATPCTSVSMHIVHAGGACGAGACQKLCALVYKNNKKQW